jgi:hypothetical protein
VSSSPAAPIDLRYLRVIVETDRSFAVFDEPGWWEEALRREPA